MRYDLNNWSVVADPYQAPELGIRLQGVRSGDNKYVITSHVRLVNGREITTRSGSVYVLCEPDSGYVAWLAEQGKTINSENPIRFNPTP